MSDYKLYEFDVPNSWTVRFPEMWNWDTVEALGDIGLLLDEHREWFWETSVGLDIQQPHLVPLEDLPDEVITTALVQVSSFNDMAKDYETRRVLMSNGKVGILKQTIFRLKTDTERSKIEKDMFGEWAIPEMIFADFIVDIEGEDYIANDSDIRWIDRSEGLLPSIEFNRLMKDYSSFIYRQKNKVISLSDWKKKKESEKSS